MKSIVHWFLFIPPAIAVMIISAVQTHWLYLRFTPPYVYYGAWTDTPLLAPNGELSIVFDFERRRYCPTELNYYVMRDKDYAVVWRDRVPGSGIKIGRSQVRTLHDMPTDMIPGPYTFRVIRHAQCNDGTHTDISPEVKFEIHG